jgi:hypothetical protein
MDWVLESVQGTLMDNLEFKNLIAVVVVAVADRDVTDIVFHFFKLQKTGRLTIQFR